MHQPKVKRPRFRGQSNRGGISGPKPREWYERAPDERKIELDPYETKHPAFSITAGSSAAIGSK